MKTRKLELTSMRAQILNMQLINMLNFNSYFSAKDIEI